MKIYYSRPTCTALVLEGTRIIRFPCDPSENAVTKAAKMLAKPPSDPYSYGIFQLISEDEPEPEIFQDFKAIHERLAILETAILQSIKPK